MAIPARKTGFQRPVDEFGGVAEDAGKWWGVVTGDDEVVGRLVFGAVVTGMDVGTVFAHFELIFG